MALNTILNSGAKAAKARGVSPPRTKNIPPMIVSIAIIVTPTGRILVELFSVLYRGQDGIWEFNLVS
jgi:hypothetical protein